MLTYVHFIEQSFDFSNIIINKYLSSCKATIYPLFLISFHQAFSEIFYFLLSRHFRTGFHCGNTASSCLILGELKGQLIVNRLLEAGKKPETTRSILEGRIKSGDMTIFRLELTTDPTLHPYAPES